VEDSVALLFSEGHFPSFESPDCTAREALGAIVRDARLNSVMVGAGLRGSIGSVALLMRVLKGRVFIDVLETPFLHPEWAVDEPDALCRVSERYKVSGANLRMQGYTVDNPQGNYWFQRVWDREYERWYMPIEVGKLDTMAEDPKRTVRHGLGFVPIVWIRNLPGGTEIDGQCTFRCAVDTSIEIDYQLSQAGRGLKYSVPPTTQSNDGWISLANQSWTVAVANTGAGATSTGAVSVAMSSVANLLVGQTVSGTSVAGGTIITAIAGNTLTLSAPIMAQIPAATKLSFGSLLASASTAETYRQSYNAALRRNYTAMGCAGIVDDDKVFADSGGSGKWRADLGQASLDGVHPSTALHQAAVSAGLITAARFLLQ